MNLVEYLQSLASITLSTIATIFEFLGGLPFFIFLFAIFYLVLCKKTAYNYFLTYASGFIIGSLFLKNIINRVRPYNVNSNLMSNRNFYSGSMPSSKCILSAESSCFIYNKTLNKTSKNSHKIILISLLILINVFVGLSQIYFANNYLLDCLIGFIIGIVLSIIILNLLSKVNINKKYILIIAEPLLFILLLVYLIWFNNFYNSAVYEFIGISSSIILGSYLEEKFIKFNENKNNLFFTSFKVLITLIILTVYYYLCKLLPGIVLFSFLKYFIVGIIVTLILPIIYKKLEEYFYVFSVSVKKDNIEISSISLSVKGTKKIAKKIYKTLNAGDVVLLSGDLGAGKSELVRAILTYAGITKEITSPTFTIVNEYSSNKNHFYHFDMYRIEDEQEVINIDFSELIDNKDAIKFIEWPEKVENLLPNSYKKITIVKLGKKSRNIIVENYVKEDKSLENNNVTNNLKNKTTPLDNKNVTQ